LLKYDLLGSGLAAKHHLFLVAISSGEAFMNGKSFSSEVQIFPVAGVIKVTVSELQYTISCLQWHLFLMKNLQAGGGNFLYCAVHQTSPVKPIDVLAGITEFSKPLFTAFATVDPVMRCGRRIMQSCTLGVRHCPLLSSTGGIF